MELSIIIPSKDRFSILLQSLEKAYWAVKNIDAEIIIINDSKTEGITIPEEWKDKIRVFSNPKSGVASARNLGAEKASADLLLFMDDDMWISMDNVHTTLSLHKTYSSNSCINLNWVYPPELQKQIKKTQFGRYLNYFGFDSLKGWNKGGTWDDSKIFQVGGITSQYLSISKEDFLKTGGYNENFPHAGFEDHDFSLRLLSNNIQPYIYPLSMVYHNEADRMDIKNWLARKFRGGQTRRVAVEMGYSDLNYDYGIFKSNVYKTLIPIQSIVLNTLSSIPNLPIFDPLYFRILNLILGTVLYEGFNKRMTIKS